MILKKAANKKYIILIVITVILVLLFAIIRLTQMVYWDNYEINISSVSDAEYLGVSDLKLLKLGGNSDTKKYLENLSQHIIKKSFESDGKDSGEYKSIVSDDIFKRLNPNRTGIEKSNFSLSIDATCLCNKNKAIVFLSRECSTEIPDVSKIICKLNTKDNPVDRLYYEKIDGVIRDFVMNFFALTIKCLNSKFYFPKTM